MSSETRRSWGPLEVVVASSVVFVSLGIAVMWLTSCGGREVSRRIQCTSNLRQVGLALVTLENSRQSYPSYLNRLGGQPASWVLPSLAYLERMDLVKEWEGAAPGFPGAHATRLDFLLCPSDSPKEDIIAPLSYVANAGIPDRTNANNAPADKLANGVFQNRLEEVSLPAMTLAFLNGHDGAAHTLLVGENVQAGQWASNGQYKALESGRLIVAPAGFFSAEQAERLTAIVWHPTQAHPGTSVQERRINFGHDRDFDEAPTIDFSRPSSFHSGGANVVLADSRVKFLSDEIDYGVYVALMTPDGANSDAPDVSIASEPGQTWRTTDGQIIDRLLHQN